MKILRECALLALLFHRFNYIDNNRARVVSGRPNIITVKVLLTVQKYIYILLAVLHCALKLWSCYDIALILKFKFLEIFLRSGRGRVVKASD